MLAEEEQGGRIAARDAKQAEEVVCRPEIAVRSEAESLYEIPSRLWIISTCGANKAAVALHDALDEGRKLRLCIHHGLVELLDNACQVGGTGHLEDRAVLNIRP